MRTFPQILSARQANNYINIKRRDKETLKDLTCYMATLGALMVDGSFRQIFEVNPDGKVEVARINPEGYISPKSIIRKEGCQYYSSYSKQHVEDKTGHSKEV